MNLASLVLVPLFEASFIASLAILLLVPARRLFRRWVPSGVSYTLWTFVFIRLCYPYFGPVSLVPKPWRSGILIAQVAASATKNAVVDMARGEAPFPGVAPQGKAPAGIQTTAVLLKQGPLILLVGWFAGFLIAEGVAFSRRRRFHKAVLAQSSPVDPRVVAIIQAEADTAPENKKPVLAITSTAVGAPACYRASWRQTWIVIPPGLADQLSPEELRMVILHELAHWRRGDLKIQGFLRFAARIHWFNPIVQWGLSVSRSDCETACDASVLEKLTPQETSLYGMTLLKVARLMKAGTLPAATVGIVEGRSHLSQRIRDIASFNPSGFMTTFNGLALTGSFALILLVLSPTVRPAMSSATADEVLSNQPSKQRFKEAQSFAKTGRNAEALADYEWCFDTGMKEDRGMGAVRRSFLLSAWAELGKDYPPAKSALVARRDAAQESAEQSSDFNSWEDFLCINRSLGEGAKNLEFYDALKKSGGSLPDPSLVFNEFLQAKRYQEAAWAQTFAQYASNFANYQRFELISSKMGRSPRPAIDGQPMELVYLVHISGEELEALAGSGDLGGAKAVVTKMLQVNSSPQTLKMLREYASRAGHPELVSQ